MATTDEAIREFCEVMAARFGRDPDFELALGELVGRVRVAHERRMRDAEAAQLLPRGPVVCMERLGVARRTVYHMAARHRKRVQGSR